MRAEFFRADQDPGAVQEVTCGWACYQHGHKYALTVSESTSREMDGQEEKLVKEEVIEISSDTENEVGSRRSDSEEESADDNESMVSASAEDEEPTSPQRKRPKPSGDEMNNDWKESAEANHVAKLPLWGVHGMDTFNIGAQYVEGLISSKGFKDFAGAGTKHFKEFKDELALVKSWTWNWGGICTSKRQTKMEESGSRLKVSLCKAVANFRVALSGATDPGNMIYKEEAEDDKEETLKIKKIVARNLLVSLSYLVSRVVPSTRLALYVECAQVLATALSLGGSDRSWLGGLEEKWKVMVDQLKIELPELVKGVCPLRMSIAAEQVDKEFPFSKILNDSERRVFCRWPAN